MEPSNQEAHQDFAGALHKINAEAVGSNGIPLQGTDDAVTASRTRDTTEQDNHCLLA